MNDELFARAARGLGGAPETGVFVPGRIEFLGKHTDYAGGRSLVFATEQGIAFVLRHRPDRRMSVTDARTGERVEFPLDPGIAIPAGDWSAYPITVARRLARDFPGLAGGLDLAFASDIPPAAGLSSSSALVVGVFLAIDAVNALRDRPDFRAVLPALEDLAGYLGAVENGKGFGAFPPDQGVGTQGGSQDQTAVLCSQAGTVMQYGWDPVRLERVLPWPGGHRVVVAVSGVSAAKTREAMASYNLAAETSAELLRRWNAATGRADRTLARALRSSPEARTRLAAALLGAPPRLLDRLDQFYAESEEIIPAAGDALARGDLAALGALVDRSQAGAERGLHNQIPETIHLARSARELGAVAASAFGAGFGGSVWAMVPEPRAEDFARDWMRRYAAAFPGAAAAARSLVTRPGPAAIIL
jgi:galactokinase